MNNISPEILIYIDRIKNFFKSNADARDYFINGGNEEEFYTQLMLISEKNFKDNGQPEVSREQLETLRKLILIEKIVKKKDFYSEDGLFLFFDEFPAVCMN